MKRILHLVRALADAPERGQKLPVRGELVDAVARAGGGNDDIEDKTRLSSLVRRVRREIYKKLGELLSLAGKSR